jgi:hypothetical protein
MTQCCLRKECVVFIITLLTLLRSLVPFWFKKENFSHNSLQKTLIKIMIQALLRVNLGFIYTFNLTMRFHTRSLPCPLKKYRAPI